MPKVAAKSARELRRFGLVMTIPLTVLGGLMVWRGRGAGPYLLVVGGAFLLTALLAPRALGPVERVWMRFAERVSVVSTFVILTLSYFLVITPFGLVLRAMGKDLLQMRWNRAGSTYWHPVEGDSGEARPDRPY